MKILSDFSALYTALSGNSAAGTGKTSSRTPPPLPKKDSSSGQITKPKGPLFSELDIVVPVPVHPEDTKTATRIPQTIERTTNIRGRITTKTENLLIETPGVIAHSGFIETISGAGHIKDGQKGDLHLCYLIADDNPQRGDIRIDLRVTPDEVKNGKVLTVTVPRKVVCPHCSAQPPAQQIHKGDATSIDYTLRIDPQELKKAHVADITIQRVEPCECNGDGCEACANNGMLIHEVDIPVTIPPLDQQTTLKYAELGHKPRSDMARGTLYLTIIPEVTPTCSVCSGEGFVDDTVEAKIKAEPNTTHRQIVLYLNQGTQPSSNVPRGHVFLVFNIIKTRVWPLDEPYFSIRNHAENGQPRYDFTLRHLLEGVLVTGGIGSSKTTVTMRTIGKACLERGCGALILCVKETEAQEWVRMAAKAGRSKDVFLINSACQYRTNVLDYHHRATERNTENVVDLLATLSSFTGGTKDAGGDGAEWREAAKMMFRNCIDLLYLAGHDVSFDELNKLRLSLPSSLEDVDDTDFMKSCYAHQLYQEAVERLRKLPRGANQHKDLATCKNYLFSEWPGYGDKQQGSIVMMVTTVIDAFSRGDLNNLFCQWGNSEGVWGNEKTGWKKGTLSLTPDLIFSHGAIVIIDISQKKYKAFGSVANALWKFLFQSAADRRTDLHLGDAARPAVLICDEHQEFFSETDTDFQGTSRSLKVFQLFATQNLDQYYRKIPNRAVVDALLGVLQLKFGHRNGHEGTNKYYCALIGEEWQMTGSSKSKNPAANGQKATSSTSSNMGYAAALKPEIFNTLASGGPIFNFQGGVIIHQVGRTFGTKNYARTTLNQVLI